MPIPTREDAALAEIDALHGAILVGLRVWRHAGPKRDSAVIRERLQQYADLVVGFVNED